MLAQVFSHHLRCFSIQAKERLTTPRVGMTTILGKVLDDGEGHHYSFSLAFLCLRYPMGEVGSRKRSFQLAIVYHVNAIAIFFSLIWFFQV
jgi:hypothetical protein